MTTAIENKTAEPDADPELAWRLSLTVGDEVALRDVDEDGSPTYSIVEVLEHNGDGTFPGDLFTDETQIVTDWEAFSRETGFYVDGDSKTSVVYPSAKIREQIELSTMLQEQWNFRSESLQRLRAIAWVLDIKHGPAPGFDCEDYDIQERADTLEMLLSAVGIEGDIDVNCFQASHRILKRTASYLIDPEGPRQSYSVGFNDRMYNVLLGNRPGAGELAHLIMYALRCLPEYVAMLRDIVRNEATSEERAALDAEGVK